MKRILIFMLFSLTGQLLAQVPQDTVQFPIILRPGDSFEVQEKYLIKDTNNDSAYIVNVGELFLLRDIQARRLAKMANKQTIDSTMAHVLEKQVEILKLIQQEKDGIIALNREGYLHYRDLWEETDRKLEEERIKSSKNFKWGFYTGVGATFITITLFKLIADNNN